MMKTIKMLPLLTVALFLASCIVQSVNRFYTETSVCAVPAIAGEWRPLDDKGSPAPVKPWIFGENKVLTYEKNNAPANLKVTYFSVGKAFFMDSTADDPGEGANQWWSMHVFPVHIVAKIEIQDNRLTLTPLDYRWLEKAIKAKTITLSHIIQKEGDTLLFTASPEEWSGFLKKYAADKEVFSETNALRFIR
ncbi:MAG: hypothetical protein C0402_00915 [Thermodesulfovibrio sp.]|nr:hypothetical protein [Thermodesulfovibrio sp.]